MPGLVRHFRTEYCCRSPFRCRVCQQADDCGCGPVDLRTVPAWARRAFPHDPKLERPVSPRQAVRLPAWRLRLVAWCVQHRAGRALAGPLQPRCPESWRAPRQPARRWPRPLAVVRHVASGQGAPQRSRRLPLQLLVFPQPVRQCRSRPVAADRRAVSARGVTDGTGRHRRRLSARLLAQHAGPYRPNTQWVSGSI